MYDLKKSFDELLIKIAEHQTETTNFTRADPLKVLGTGFPFKEIGEFETFDEGLKIQEHHRTALVCIQFLSFNKLLI